MTSPVPPTGRIGTVVADRYEIHALLGEGGMARVYAAHDRKHDRQVAIKMLRPELTVALGTDRFLREIRIAARLTHPHILPLYDSGEDAGALYYVMPLIEGESLGDRLSREGAVPMAEAVRIAREVAEALTYAHEQGFVHRDIKPDNIMLARGHALVADFGIARVVSGAGNVSLTATGMSLGTPLYMSPEQALGDQGLDQQTDIYSLGCVVFEMLTGRPPFVSDNVTSLLARHISETAPDLPEEFPSDVAEATARSLAKQPTDRFPTAIAFADALAHGIAPGPASATARRRKARALLPWWKRPIGALASGAVRTAATAGRRFWGLERWQRLGVAMVLLFLVFLMTGLRAFRYSIVHWNAGLESSPVPDSTLGPWLGSWTEQVPMIALSDTAIGIEQGPVLEVFNGKDWKRVLLPYSYPALARVGTEVWAFDGAEPGREQRLTTTGWVAGDSVPVAVYAVWSRDSEIVVSNWKGELAERSRNGWRQLPSGRHTPILRLFGPSKDSIIGLGEFSQSDLVPDSLIRRQGSFWPSYDPQGGKSDERDQWIYQDGVTLENGASIVVGYEDIGSRRQVALVLRKAAGGQEWKRISTSQSRIPQHRFDHILAVPGEEALAWSEEEPGLVIMRPQQFEPIEVLNQRAVRAATLLGESPVVLTDVGTLMIRRGGEFEVFGEVPLRPRTGTGYSSHGQLMALTRLLGGSPFLAIARAVRTGNRTWMLMEDGSVYSAECNVSGCDARLEISGRPRAVTDLTALGDSVIVVGKGGLFQRWNGKRWSAASDMKSIHTDFHLVDIARNGALVIAGADSAYLIYNGVHAVGYEGRSTPAMVTAGSDSGVALLWTDLIELVAWNGAVLKTFRMPGTALTSARWTCDGRLITTSANPGDPLIGGNMSVAVGTQPFTQLPELPIPLDLSDVVTGAWGEIVLFGRGGVWMGSPLVQSDSAACGLHHPIRGQYFTYRELDW